MCTQFTPSLLTSLTYLIYSMLQSQVAVITDSCACSDTFFNELKKSVYNSRYKVWLDIQLSQARVKTNLDRESAGNQYYRIKSGGFNVIILLTSKHLYRQVFWYANHFSLLSSPIIWVVPNVKTSDLESGPLPARWLSFSVVRDNFQAKLFTRLKEIVETSSYFLQK